MWAASACGGGEVRPPAAPDESRDLGSVIQERTGSWLRGTVPATPALGGTQWRWVQAACTEGTPELAERGFAQQLRVEADAEGLLLLQDHFWRKPSPCVQTVALRAVPGQEPEAEWTIRTEAFQALPVGCGVRPDEERPGHVRRRGQRLELFVQRSRWCGGLELRMVYEPMQPTPLADDQLVRHFAIHFSRRDALRLSRLFAARGALAEPFTPSPSGVTRHIGRTEVHAWFAQAFAPVPWVALRLTEAAAAEEAGHWRAKWEYMDPRLQEPATGSSDFTVGGGEILELRLALAAPPKERPAGSRRAAEATPR